MSDYFTGQIVFWASPKIPIGFHLCDGSLLSISEYPALYSLIGTVYGGTASSFNLPDLRGRVPISSGQGTNLTARIVGQSGGVEVVTLAEGQVPPHTHPLLASTATATTNVPTNAALAAVPTGKLAYFDPPATTPPTPAPLAYSSVTEDGGGNQAHPNIMPYTALNYIICTNGIYPVFN